MIGSLLLSKWVYRREREEQYMKESTDSKPLREHLSYAYIITLLQSLPFLQIIQIRSSAIGL